MNFQKYQPGLVGGHCIPVDPYYLYDFAKINLIFLIPLSRKINDRFINWIAENLLKEINKIPLKKF